MKLNVTIKKSFEVIVSFLSLIEIFSIVAVLGHFGSIPENFKLILNNFVFFGLIGVPIILLILGIYGLIKKENKNFSIAAIVSGLIVPFLFIIILSFGKFE